MSGRRGAVPRACGECRPRRLRVAACKCCAVPIGPRVQLCDPCREAKRVENNRLRGLASNAKKALTRARRPPPLTPEEKALRLAERRAREKERRRLSSGFYNRPALLAAKQAERAAEREGRRRERNAGRKPWFGLSVADKARVRRREDPEWAAKERLRIQMRKRHRFRNLEVRLRTAASHPGAKSGMLVRMGYTPGELRAHLERQFTKGMSWSRFIEGDIQIDHIVPVASFDLDDEADVRACWALTNLRPMWKAENRAKWAHREHLL